MITAANANFEELKEAYNSMFLGQKGMFYISDYNNERYLAKDYIVRYTSGGQCIIFNDHGRLKKTKAIICGQFTIEAR